jgi:hypothetical protein
MFKCCTVHVQIKSVKVELQRISKVPRTVGGCTRFTISEGIVQLGWKVLEAETSFMKRDRPPNEETILVYTVVGERGKGKTLGFIVECKNIVDSVDSDSATIIGR